MFFFSLSLLHIPHQLMSILISIRQMCNDVRYTISGMLVRFVDSPYYFLNCLQFIFPDRSLLRHIKH
uniref:Uncharacterized protein n=1 Tax=Octopus bimaculoides TaxID=37653 RepID=A0A0L8H1J7_OCTBM